METPPNKPLHGSRILVVEDEPLLAFDILKTLRAAGAETVGPALSLARAIELATTAHADCAILDVMLRDGTVFPAARLLRSQGSGFLFYSGIFDIGVLKRSWPGARVLLKPAPPELLVQAVRAACGLGASKNHTEHIQIREP